MSIILYTNKVIIYTSSSWESNLFESSTRNLKNSLVKILLKIDSNPCGGSLIQMLMAISSFII